MTLMDILELTVLVVWLGYIGIFFVSIFME